MSMLLPLLLLSVADSSAPGGSTAQAHLPRTRLAALLAVLDDLQHLRKPSEVRCHDKYSLDTLRDVVITLRRENTSIQTILRVVEASIGDELSEENREATAAAAPSIGRHMSRDFPSPTWTGNDNAPSAATDDDVIDRPSFVTPWSTDDSETGSLYDRVKGLSTSQDLIGFVANNRKTQLGGGRMKNHHNLDAQSDLVAFYDDKPYDGEDTKESVEKEEQDYVNGEFPVINDNKDIQRLYVVSPKNSLLHRFSSLASGSSLQHSKADEHKQNARKQIVVLPFHKTNHRTRPRPNDTYPIHQAQSYPIMHQVQRTPKFGTSAASSYFKHAKEQSQDDDSVGLTGSFQNGFQAPPTGVDIIIDSGDDVWTYNVTLLPSMSVFKALYEARVNSYSRSSPAVLDYRIQSRPGCHFISRVNDVTGSREDGAKWTIRVYDSKGIERYHGDCLPSSSAVRLTTGYKILLKYDDSEFLVR